MSTKGVNVKILRTRLISELINRLAKMQDEVDSHKVDVKKYEDEETKWIKSVGDTAHKSKDFDVHTYQASSDDDSKIRVQLLYIIDKKSIPSRPESPRYPYPASGYGRSYIGSFEDRKVELSNAIRVLEMSDDEFINASTYSAVTKYL